MESKLPKRYLDPAVLLKTLGTLWQSGCKTKLTKDADGDVTGFEMEFPPHWTAEQIGVARAMAGLS